MSIERIFYCDGPDCERTFKTRKRQPPMFVTISEHGGPALRLCGWDCVLPYAAAKEPEQIIAGPGSFDVN